MAAPKFSTVLGSAGRECWIALSEDESAVVGRGETPTDAIEEAKRAGVGDPILFWVPKDWTPMVMRSTIYG